MTTTTEDPSNKGREPSGSEIAGHTVWLSRDQLSALGIVFAETIHAAVISMHLRVVETNPALFENYLKRQVAEIRRTVCSLAGYDRRDFVSTLRYHFLKLREEKGTDARWQDYAAKVQAYRKTEGRVAA